MEEENYHAPLEDSGAPIPPWIELPDLVLELIFEKLNFKSLSLTCNRESLRNVLSCRAVHTKWKISMDKILERKSLEKYTKWNPDDKSNINMGSFPNLQLITSSTQQPMLCWTACDPNIYSGNYVGCPFPTKSVRLTFNKLRRFFEGDRLIRVENFFLKTGHYLNSIVFFNILVTPQVFQSLLKNTPHLQAIELDSVKFTNEYFQNMRPSSLLAISPLAPLPKLKNISVTNLQFQTAYVFDGYPDLYTWILSPYASSLTSLHSDAFKKWSYPNNREPLPQFPILKHMKFMQDFDWTIFIKAENPDVFSNLESISFDTFEDNKELQALLRFIGKFTNTMTSLHLDFERSWTYGRRQPLRWAKERRNVQDFSLSFPHMRTFGIFYPHGEQELGLLKQFLHTFPNLTKLKLLRFKKGCCSDTETKPEFRIKVSQYIERKLNDNGIEQQILTLCPNLKKLTVSLNDREESLVYTKSF